MKAYLPINYKIEKEKDVLKIEIDGNRTTLSVLLSKYLVDREDVNFAGWKIDHPSKNNSILIINAKNPEKILKEVIDKIIGECESIEESLKPKSKKSSK